MYLGILLKAAVFFYYLLLTTNTSFFSLFFLPPGAFPNSSLARNFITCPETVDPTPTLSGSWVHWRLCNTWCATATNGLSSKLSWPYCCWSWWLSSSTACLATWSRRCWVHEETRQKQGVLLHFSFYGTSFSFINIDALCLYCLFCFKMIY